MNQNVTSIIESCFSAIENQRSPILRQHEAMVGTLSFVFANLMNFDYEYANTIRFVANLHDIGKIIITDETELINDHTNLGFNILNSINHEKTYIAAKVALHHHECWDGSGYPHKLSGDNIPIEARIVSICDTYDHLRATVIHDSAVQAIIKISEKFDPELLTVFLTNSDTFNAAYKAALNNPIPLIISTK